MALVRLSLLDLTWLGSVDATGVSRKQSIAKGRQMQEGILISNYYAGITIRFEGGIYQIARADIHAGLRGANVRVEVHLDGTLKVRFQERYLAVSPRCPPPKAVAPTREALLLLGNAAVESRSDRSHPYFRLAGRMKAERRAKPARRSSRFRMQSLCSRVSPAAERVPNRKALPASRRPNWAAGTRGIQRNNRRWQ